MSDLPRFLLDGRCYSCDNPARYEAHLDYDLTPVVLLCDECALWERDWGSVEWIRTRKSAAGNHIGAHRE